ncbi:FOG: Transposon-encoded proteins with TYA, reverse transcriptase, integrase domains in various combinations, partial [Plasmopara halstedii]
MRIVLEERDLWEVTSGEIKLEQLSIALDQSTFKRKARKALAIICLAMEDSQLPLVRSAKDAYDAWSRLEGHFEKKSLANKLFLRRRFFTAKMDEGDDVLTHINKMKTLAEQLDVVGAPVTEDDLVITLLGSLTDDAKAVLLQRKHQVLVITVVSLDIGLQNVQLASVKTQSVKDRSVQMLPRARTTRVIIFFSVGGNKCVPKSSCVWLVDSGATQHMTYSKEYMKNYKVMTPVDVHLANDGIVQAVGSGDIVMTMDTPCGMKKGVLTLVWHIPNLSRNLFSVGRFTKDVGPVTFERDGCFAEAKGLRWKIGAREGKGLFK